MLLTARYLTRNAQEPMTIASEEPEFIHPSVYSHAAAPLRWVEATPRPHGALRYQCPVTDSFICVTDDETLSRLNRPRARVRCPSCGEIHLLTQDYEAEPIVAASAEP